MRVDRSIANLREVSVPYFNNVPLGYAMLVDAMDRDLVLRDTFFAKMRLMLYGGAGLPQHVYDRLQQHAVAATGHRVHMTTGYGMTETVSGCCAIARIRCSALAIASVPSSTMSRVV